MGINFVFACICFFFYYQAQVAADLHFMNHKDHGFS